VELERERRAPALRELHHVFRGRRRHRSWYRRAAILARQLTFHVLFVAFFLVGRTEALKDPGTYWHLETGDLILATGAAPTHDTFSASFHGAPWIAMQWLAEAAMALVFRVTGYDGLLVLASAAVAATFAPLAGRLSDAGLRGGVTLVLVALGVAASAHHFHVRPHLVTILGVAATARLVADVDAGRRSPRALLALLPLCVLWSNLHGGVVGGIATVGAASGLFLLLPASPPALRGARGGAALAALLVGLAATTLVSPYGAELPAVWLRLLRSSVVRHVIAEHAPLALASPLAVVLLVLAAVHLALLAGVPRRAMRATHLLPLPWFVMAVTGVRNAPLYAVVTLAALPDLARASSLLGAVTRRRPASLLALAAPRGNAPSRGALVLPAIAMAATLCLARAAGGWAAPSPWSAPLALLPAMRAARVPPESGVFDDMRFGGFVIRYARLRPVIDDRCELYGDAFLAAYARAADDAPGELDAWADRFGLCLALLVPGTPFDRHAASSPRWTREAGDASAVLYVRRDCVKPP